MRSELMAAIYAKALVRKDYSGIVQKKEEEAVKGKATNGKPESSSKKKKDKKKKAKEEDKNRAGADVGKIVNLMSGDANRVAMIVGGAYFIYVSCQYFLIILES